MAIVLQDDFSDADATDLHNKALDVGGLWSVVNGTGDVNGGRARQTSSTYSDLVALADAGVTDGVASVVVNVVADTYDTAGIIVRAAGVLNYWYVVVSPTRSSIFVVERVAGNDYVRDTQTVSLSNGVDYTLTVTVSGTSISGTVNGVTASYTMGTHLTETNWGIIGNINATKFDNFSVDDSVSAGAGGSLIGGKLVGSGLLVGGRLVT